MAKTKKNNGTDKKTGQSSSKSPVKIASSTRRVEKAKTRSAKAGVSWYWKPWDWLKSVCGSVIRPSRPTAKPKPRREYLPSPVKRASAASILARRNSEVVDKEHEIVRKPKKLDKKEKYWTDHEMVMTQTGDAIQNGIHGPEYLFDVWLQMLARWFDHPGVKVYLVSPFLDSELLQDLIQVITSCGSGKNGHLERLYTRNKCYNEVTVDCLIKTGLDNDERKAFQRFIAKAIRLTYDEYFNKTYFHCKFFAGVYPSGRVELVVTSANFTRTHLGATYRQLDSLELKTTDREHFEEYYIQPLDELTRERS